MLGNRVEIGRSGWTALKNTVAGDFTGDDRTDLVVIETSTGKLWLYPNTGSTGLAMLGNRVEIGRSGWNAFSSLTNGGLTHDGRQDLLAVGTAGDPWVYPVTGNGAVQARSQLQQVGLASTSGAGAPASNASANLVEDFAYPNATTILAEQKVKLVSGDGHIVLVPCNTPAVGDIGLLKVWTTDETIGADGIGRVCFKVLASTGLLNLEVPGVYEIRGDGQKTGTGHEVTADLTTDDGDKLSVDVDPDGSTPVGLGADPEGEPTMLLRLQVTG